MNFARLTETLKALHPVAFSFLTILTVIIVAVSLQRLVIYLITKLTQKYQFATLATLIQRFKIPVLLLSVILGMSLVAPIIQLPTNTQAAIDHALSIAGIISATWIIINFVAIARMAILRRYDLSATDNFKARKIYTELKVIEQIIDTFVLIIAFSAIMMTFSRVREIGVSILASAGFITAIIGFAAQKSLANILAGLQVALAQPIRLDDVVIVENEWGIIEEITLNYVVVKIWDKRRLIIPITYFLEKPFQNWSRKSTDLLGFVMIYTDYIVPVDKLRAELARILQDHPKWDRQANVIQVTDARPEVIELRVLVSASNAGKLWDLRCDVRERLIDYIRNNYPNSLPRTRILLTEQQSRNPIFSAEEEVSHG